MATVVEEPIMSRLDRLDHMLRHMEKMSGSSMSPKSSGASTPTSGTLTSESSPRSIEKHCRPIDDVIVETRIKGTLIDRVEHVEERVLKLEGEGEGHERNKEEKQHHRKGLKSLVKKVVKSSTKHKTEDY